jgi:hypothetical protein
MLATRLFSVPLWLSSSIPGCRCFGEWDVRLVQIYMHRCYATHTHIHTHTHTYMRLSSFTTHLWPRKREIYSLTTSALDGVSGQCHAPATLYPRKRISVPFGQNAGWAPEPVWTQRLEEESFDTILTELPRITHTHSYIFVCQIKETSSQHITYSFSSWNAMNNWFK